MFPAPIPFKAKDAHHADHLVRPFRVPARCRRPCLIDPFFTGNPAFVTDKEAAIKGVTRIVLTHGRADHVGDTLPIAEATGAPVVANYDLCMWLAGKGLRNSIP
jgi:glyoxylase-like metal-dependent hydrolase (beta-lactamase superfamily II)